MRGLAQDDSPSDVVNRARYQGGHPGTGAGRVVDRPRRRRPWPLAVFLARCLINIDDADQGTNVVSWCCMLEEIENPQPHIAQHARVPDGEPWHADQHHRRQAMLQR
ncbi:MAG TPA: hypothetical protein VM659_22380 [Dongiaceae bacterium]|nr:hypothetical protein [Dongiaceae bacterium]